MLTTTHLAIAVIVGLLLSLNRDEWFVALTFGVLIDFDHVLAAPEYISNNGWSAILRPTWDDGTGFQWKSLLHYPIGAGVVIPLAVGWRHMLPFLFWGVHLSVDYLQEWTLSYSAPMESLVLAGAIAAIFAFGYNRWKETRPDAVLKDYIIHLRAALRSSVFPPSRTSQGGEDST